MDTIWKHLTFKAVPLLANLPVFIGLVVAILAEPVAHAARHDALLSVAALDVSLAALPTPAVQLVHAAGAVGSPVADPPESAKDWRFSSPSFPEGSKGEAHVAHGGAPTFCPTLKLKNEF